MEATTTGFALAFGADFAAVGREGLEASLGAGILRAGGRADFFGADLRAGAAFRAAGFAFGF
jgi:hypothetical protein